MRSIKQCPPTVPRTLRDDVAMLVTFDGIDGCVEYGACGVNSRQLAAYLLDYVHVDSAMKMDQGPPGVPLQCGCADSRMTALGSVRWAH